MAFGIDTRLLLILTFVALSDNTVRTGHISSCNVLDPCQEANTSVPFEMFARYENCPYKDGVQLCDRYINPVWYNFGEDILDHCPELLSCGSIYPIWMNGTLPTLSDGAVSRYVCKVGLSTCCMEHYEILIKNCGSFNAYCLPPLSGCPERYCFGTHGVCVYPTTTQAPTTKPPVTSSPSCSLDPCIEINIHSLPDPYERSGNCPYRQESTSCDRYLEQKWYKFETNILNSCPSLLSCGAVYPVWMQGSIPTTSEGVVNRKACKAGLNNCCAKKYDISVKNCGKYIAYCLASLDGCSERYCFGRNGTCTPPVKSEAKDDGVVVIAVVVVVVFLVFFTSIAIPICIIKMKKKDKNSVGSETSLQSEDLSRELTKASLNKVEISQPPPDCRRSDN